MFSWKKKFNIFIALLFLKDKINFIDFLKTHLIIHKGPNFPFLHPWVRMELLCFCFSLCAALVRFLNPFKVQFPHLSQENNRNLFFSRSLWRLRWCIYKHPAQCLIQSSLESNEHLGGGWLLGSMLLLLLHEIFSPTDIHAVIQGHGAEGMTRVNLAPAMFLRVSVPDIT